MADDAVQNEQEAQPKRARMGMILGLLAGVIGAGGGAALIGPMVAERLNASPAEAAASGDDHGGGHGGGGDHGAAAGPTFVVENLVLNPAETKGTRFLMTTVVASLDNAGAVAELQAREPEVRDRLMALLGSKTVDELADVRNRDALKQEIRAALEEIAEPSQVGTVFLPTFVIQ